MASALEIGNKFTTGKNNQKTKLPKEMLAFQETLEPIANKNLLYKIDDNHRVLLELNRDSEIAGGIDELLRGEFSVFGKVTRIEKDGYNIFESTDLGLFKPEALNDLLSAAFSEAVSDEETKKMFDVTRKCSYAVQRFRFDN
jgi:hypothetical protein